MRYPSFSSNGSANICVVVTSFGVIRPGDDPSFPPDQRRQQSLSVADPEQIRRIAEAILDEPVSGSDPDAWLSELKAWVDENSVLVKRVFRGVTRAFGDDATLDELEETLEPALGGEVLDADDIAADTIETQAGRFDRAKWLFHTPDGETLWDRFTNRTSEMQRLYPGADVTAEMQAIINSDDIPAADRLQALLDDAEAHRRQVVREQYERITGETPGDDEPESLVSSLATWLFTHDGSSKETADRVVVEFDGVTIDDLYDLFERAWNGDTFSEEDIVDPAIVQQADQYASARRLLEGEGQDGSLWSQLRDAAKRLEDEYPNHPITDDVTKTLSQSQPPSVDEVQLLLKEAGDPFEVDERLEELAGELQAEYPDHEITLAVVDAVERDTPPSDERIGELIEEAERLLEGVDEQLRRIQETIDDLEDNSAVLIE